MKLIVAGSYKEYKEYLDKHTGSNRKKDYRYAGTSEDLIDLLNPEEVIFTGEYWNSPLRAEVGFLFSRNRKQKIKFEKL